jgi:hypothetical protein
VTGRSRKNRAKQRLVRPDHKGCPQIARQFPRRADSSRQRADPTPSDSTRQQRAAASADWSCVATTPASTAPGRMPATLLPSSPSPHCRWPRPTLQQGIERQLVLPAAASENGGHDPSPRSLWTAACLGRAGMRRRLAREPPSVDAGTVRAGQGRHDQGRGDPHGGRATRRL